MSPIQGILRRVKSGRTRQQGMVLLLCLIFMTALTLLGLSASTDTITQTQLAANLHDAERARQNAQLSLQWAEQWLSGLAGPAPQSCSSGCSGFVTQPAASLGHDLQSASFTWWTAHGYEVGLDPQSGVRLASVGVPGADPPIWIIQSLYHSAATADGSTPALDWYRILVRTTGQSSNTVAVTESIVKKSWGATGSAALPVSRVAWQELR